MHFRRERKSGTTVSLQETLEAGKDADLVLWTADPLTTIGGEAYMTIVNGEIVYQAE